MSRLDRRVLWIIAGLAVLLIIVLAGRQGGARIRANGANPGETIVTGAYGPLALTFADAPRPDSLEAAFRLEPPVSGRFVWEGEGSRSAAFWPDKPLIPGQRYTLTIQAGLTTGRGPALRKAITWPVEVRQPELLYLAPSQAPELWQARPDGQNARQLSATGGKVYDYAAAPDGSRVLFSAYNEQGGIDLWEMERGAEAPALLLPCGTDWCFEAAYAPDLRRIAYSRRTFSGIKGSAPGVPRLWIYDRAEKATDALLSDPGLGGIGAAWSPDGRFLAFTDPVGAVVRVVDFSEKAEFSVPGGAESRIAWSPSGASFFMTRPESGEAYPYVLVYEVDTATRQARLWEGERDLSKVDYSLPVPSPDGSWLAVARRLVGAGPGKQLWVMHVDGSQRRALTLDPTANYAGYQWDPTSTRLVFQRLSFHGSNSLPQVVLWNREDPRQTVIAENAFQPRWLP